MHEIKHDGKLLAIIDDIMNIPKGLGFYGSKEDYIQVGKFCYEQGKELRPHRHIIRERIVWKTQEILIVLRGSVQATTFAETGTQVVDSRQIGAGEYYISYRGGVGFTILENDTRMLEIKPGPFNISNDDEERELL